MNQSSHSWAMAVLWDLEHMSLEGSSRILMINKWCQYLSAIPILFFIKKQNCHHATSYAREWRRLNIFAWGPKKGSNIVLSLCLGYLFLLFLPEKMYSFLAPNILYTPRINHSFLCASVAADTHAWLLQNLPPCMLNVISPPGLWTSWGPGWCTAQPPVQPALPNTINVIHLSGKKSSGKDTKTQFFPQCW